MWSILSFSPFMPGPIVPVYSEILNVTIITIVSFSVLYLLTTVVIDIFRKKIPILKFLAVFLLMIFGLYFNTYIIPAVSEYEIQTKCERQQGIPSINCS